MGNYIKIRAKVLGKEETIFLFKNNDKEADNDPDYNAYVPPNDQEEKLIRVGSAWINKSKE